MAFQAVPDVVGINVRGSYQSIPWENTFYAKYVAVPSEEELDELAEDVLANVNANWLDMQSTACEIREVYVRDLAAEIAFQALAANTPAEPGTVSGGTLPTYTAVAVQRRSGLTGRSSRGRIFWTGMTEGQVTGNVVDTALIAGIVAAMVSLDNVITANGMVPVVVSRYANNVKRPTGVAYTLTGWSVLNNLIDTRRSRKQAE